MSDPANHWKLGLFVVLSLVLGAVVLVGLGAKTLAESTVAYATYFDESVQGLEVGSPVKFRGVTIGRVAEISIAPDQRHVAVSTELVEANLARVGLTTDGKANVVPAELRMQLASQGLTGVKFVQLDYLPLDSNPPPELPFQPEERYVPAAVSTMKNLEDSVVGAVDRIPAVADQTLAIMTRINDMLVDLERKDVPEQAVATLHRANAVLSALERAVSDLEAGKLSQQTQSTLREVEQAVHAMNGLVTRASAEDGLYAHAELATFAVGEAAQNTATAGRELEATLRAVQGAARAIERLSDALERDSDMLLKGRAARAAR